MAIINGNHLVEGAHLRHAIWRQALLPCALSDPSDLSDLSDLSDIYPATSYPCHGTRDTRRCAAQPCRKAANMFIT